MLPGGCGILWNVEEKEGSGGPANGGEGCQECWLLGWGLRMQRQSPRLHTA